ncbi:MAG: lamin tail domain-containing protein [Fibrobacter sp.]|nr:lamin tail domain-containing protein [Fibrobacter sp.]
MNIKKWLMTGFGTAALVLFAACSSDDGSEDSPVGPADDTALSSASVDPDGNPTSGDSTDPQSSPSGGDGNSQAAPPTSSAAETGAVDKIVDEGDGYNHVAITEIMYNAPEGSALEWIELTLSSDKDIQSMLFAGMRLEGAVTFDFPAEPLAVGEYIVVTNDVDLFKQTYPQFSGRVFGPWGNDPKTGAVAKLVNEGDVIDVKLTGKDNNTSVAFGSEPPWPSLANGKGYSLVFKGGTLNPTNPSSWAANKVMLGNPGGPDEYITKTSVRLNEIKPYSLEEDEMGWIELYNSGSDPTDVAGWLFESKLKKKSWKITGSNTVVPAGGYLVLPATSENFEDDLYLSDQGGEFYLYEMVGDQRTGSESSLMLGATKGSSGVVDISDGTIAQGALATETPGEKNSALKVGPIFINEMHYHPKEGDPNDFEFLELINKGDAEVNLFVDKGETKGWKVEGVRMEFTSGDKIPAGGIMLLLPDSMSSFEASVREKQQIPETVQIRFYQGKLSNRGETVAVKQPYSFTGSGETRQWYFDWSDATLYSDRWEGFNETDGFGKSLQRVDFTTMGYEAKAWTPADPTPGK